MTDLAHSLFLPMFALVLFTFAIAILVLLTRIVSVSRRRMETNYFALMHGEGVSPAVQKTTRCYNNLFEMPVLFYAVSILFIGLGIEPASGALLGWLYVLFRVLQAAIHLTYNNPLHRLVPFLIGNVVLFVLWLDLALKFIQA